MEKLRCVVERITYQNSENGYTVIKCRAKGYQDLVAVVGIMPDVHVGSVLSLGGTWKVDGKYGKQFSVENFEETLPATVYQPVCLYSFAGRLHYAQVDKR